MGSKLVTKIANDQSEVPSLYDEVETGKYAEIISLRNDLKLGTKSLLLTMNAGVGSVPIPDTTTIIEVKPESTVMRIGLEAPEADGAATGNAVAADLKNGVPVAAAVSSCFVIGPGAGRTLYVKGGAADKIEVIMY